MKANELRIKNKIYINGREKELTAADIQTLSQFEVFGMEISNCNAIKITEEMLTSYGFSFVYEKEQDRIYSKGDISILWNRTGGCCLYVDKKCVGKPFFAFHQLQNLYFDLTGTNL